VIADTAEIHILLVYFSQKFLQNSSGVEIWVWP